jgi:hypothetical protein
MDREPTNLTEITDLSIDRLLGRRILAKVETNRTYGGSPVEEYRVLEISPSGHWVRLMNSYGNKYWRSVATVSFVEALKDIRPAVPSGKEE